MEEDINENNSSEEPDDAQPKRISLSAYNEPNSVSYPMFKVGVLCHDSKYVCRNIFVLPKPYQAACL